MLVARLYADVDVVAEHFGRIDTRRLEETLQIEVEDGNFQ